MTAPSDLKPGDVFRAKSGPYAGHVVEVVEKLEVRYGVFRFKCKMVSAVEVGVDYADEVQILKLGNR